MVALFLLNPIEPDAELETVPGLSKATAHELRLRDVKTVLQLFGLVCSLRFKGLTCEQHIESIHSWCSGIIPKHVATLLVEKLATFAPAVFESN